MKVILDIDDKAWEIIEKGELISSDNRIKNVWASFELMVAIDNSISLPNNATNGDVIKAITGEKFSKGASVYNHNLMIGEGEHYIAFSVDWWNAPSAPYKENKE